MNPDPDPAGPPAGAVNRPLWGPARRLPATEPALAEEAVPVRADLSAADVPVVTTATRPAASSSTASPAPAIDPLAPRSALLTQPHGNRPLVAAVAVAVLVIGAVSVIVGTAGQSSGPAAVAAGPTTSSDSSPYSYPPGTAAAPTTEASSTVSASGVAQLVADAASHPRAQTVLALVDRYFTAINSRDYNSWSSTVVPRRAAQQAADSWLRAYRSTTDSTVVINSIADTGADAVTVGLSFVSTQNDEDAPADLPVDKICWRTQWPVVDLSSGGKIDTAPRGSTTKQAC